MSVSIRRYERLPGEHIHTFGQIVLPYAGTMEIEIGSRGGRVDERQGVLIAAGQRHVFQAGPADRFVVIDMDEAASVPEHRAWFPISPAIGHLLGYVRARQGEAAGQTGLSLPDWFARPWTALLDEAIFGPEVRLLNSDDSVVGRAFRFMRAKMHRGGNRGGFRGGRAAA